VERSWLLSMFVVTQSPLRGKGCGWRPEMPTEILQLIAKGLTNAEANEKRTLMLSGFITRHHDSTHRPALGMSTCSSSTIWACASCRSPLPKNC